MEFSIIIVSSILLSNALSQKPVNPDALEEAITLEEFAMGSHERSTHPLSNFEMILFTL